MQDVELIARLRADLPAFARTCLKVKGKDGSTVPFFMNKAQLELHRRLEEQKENTGKVRAMVLKGRRMGMSTYVGARFYHRASMYRGQDVFILAHKRSATDFLFGMVDRFHRNNPLKPTTGKSNVKELTFSDMDSGYAVGTAETKDEGRGRNINLLHWSEVAFSPNVSSHFASIVQTVPNTNGSEIILESTANGVGDEFHQRWLDAEAGKSPYIAIFLPWFWDTDNRLESSGPLKLDTTALEGEMSEEEYAKTFNLDSAQVLWMREKIATLRSVALFHQEYPATSSLAFQSADKDSFIKPVVALRARKREGIEGYGPVIMGVDPAGPGGDRFAVCVRQGHKVIALKHRDKIGAMDAAHWLRGLIADHNPQMINIDAGGIGHAVISIMRTYGPEVGSKIRAVDFGAKSQHRMARPEVPGPYLRRDEMWSRMKEWLELEEGVSIPDSDALQEDICSTRVSTTSGLNWTRLESKHDMRARGIRSPDLADALALTFANIVLNEGAAERRPTQAIITPARGRDRPRTRNGWMA